MFKHSRITDIILIVLFLVVAILLGVSSYFHFNIKKRIYEDSFFINQLGLIRGNIQRYAKFKLVNKNNENILIDLELTLNNVKFLINKEKNYSEKFYKNIIAIINDIQNKIKKLETMRDKKEILSLSEKLWYESNLMIRIALLHHKTKFSKAIDTFNFIIYSTIIFLLILILYIYKKIKRGLELDAIIDKLTNLYNRLYFDGIYKYFVEKYKRDKKPFSMIILDIDNFKKINDKYGHATGDEVLKKLGNIIKSTIRKTDFAFRYGGEEFVVIFPDTKIEEAYKIAKRILDNVPQKIKIDLKNITVSIGLGEYKGEESIKFFEKVDKALYFAKNNGKNQIKITY